MKEQNFKLDELDRASKLEILKNKRKVIVFSILTTLAISLFAILTTTYYQNQAQIRETNLELIKHKDDVKKLTEEVTEKIELLNSEIKEMNSNVEKTQSDIKNAENLEKTQNETLEQLKSQVEELEKQLND